MDKNKTLNESDNLKTTISEGVASTNWLVWQIGKIKQPGWYFVKEDENSKPSVWKITMSIINGQKISPLSFEFWAGPIKEPC